MVNPPQFLPPQTYSKQSDQSCPFPKSCTPTNSNPLTYNASPPHIYRNYTEQSRPHPRVLQPQIVITCTDVPLQIHTHTYNTVREKGVSERLRESVHWLYILHMQVFKQCFSIRTSTTKIWDRLVFPPCLSIY